MLIVNRPDEKISMNVIPWKSLLLRNAYPVVVVAGGG